MPEPHHIPPTSSPSEPEATPPDAGIPVTLSTRTESVVRLRGSETFPEVDAQAGRYHLLGEIGRGGMGVVLRGRDPVAGVAFGNRLEEERRHQTT